ncbi:MAG: hypothetical protein IRY99_28165 [Isosphaeraceae bacterium]|nr:hypothetical protein [Isosphaeraceae bacterium]
MRDARFRLQVRLRTLLVLVAVSSVLGYYGAEKLRQRSASLQALAFRHARLKKFCLADANSILRRAVRVNRLARRLGLTGEAKASKQLEIAQYQKHATFLRNRAAYHAGLELKYLQAANRPWLPVKPDPPVPKP